MFKPIGHTRVFDKEQQTFRRAGVLELKGDFVETHSRRDARIVNRQGVTLLTKVDGLFHGEQERLRLSHFSLDRRQFLFNGGDLNRRDAIFSLDRRDGGLYVLVVVGKSFN